MDKLKTIQDLEKFITDQKDPVNALRTKVLEFAFGIHWIESEDFNNLLLLQPTMIDGIVRADAFEFLTSPVNESYTHLRNVMSDMRDILALHPDSGEEVMKYLDRLVKESVNVILKTT